MAKFFLLILFSFLVKPVLATEYIKVAVIDSGLDLKDSRFKGVLCPKGHKDFTNTGIEDHMGHGTHVSSLIMMYAEDSPYCLVILKYADPKVSSSQAATYFSQAILYSTKIGAKIVNISGGGNTPSAFEQRIIKGSKQIYIVAAGNDGKSLDDVNYHYYPAQYHMHNIIVVGGRMADNSRWSLSNYGRNIKWENGVDVWGFLPHNKSGYKSGTSMATAIFTGKYIYAQQH